MCKGITPNHHISPKPPSSPMDEAKAAAYYDELARKGEGAARFKQGLGFSSPTSTPLPKPSSSSSLSASFVRASSPSKAAVLHKQAQLQNIHNKLNTSSDRGHRSRDRDDRRSSERRSERDYRDDEGGGRRESSHRRSSRSRSRSPSRSRESRGGDRDHKREKEGSQRRGLKKKSADVDYSKLIEGYSQMTPAERVKAKMKFQLSQTAAKDTAMGMNTGWERFDFNMDAPLDGDDEIEVAEDDASVVKAIGKSFRSSAADAKREEDIKAAHDQAMFGAPTGVPVIPDFGSNLENDSSDTGREILRENLLSDKVFATQKGSWRDRVRRFQNSSGN